MHRNKSRRRKEGLKLNKLPAYRCLSKNHSQISCKFIKKFRKNRKGGNPLRLTKTSNNQLRHRLADRERKKMRTNKQKFDLTPNFAGRTKSLKALEKLVKRDPRSDVLSIEQIVTENGNEYAEVHFVGGGKRKVCISSNSVGATLKAVTELIYYG